MQKPINDHNYAVVNKIILSNGDGHMHTHTHRMPSVRPFTNKDIMHICMLRVIRRRTQASHRINVYMLSYRLKYFPWSSKLNGETLFPVHFALQFDEDE